MVFPFSKFKDERFLGQVDIWIKSFIIGGSVVVNVNNDIGHFFQMKKAFDRETSFPRSCLI
jgi:hypothetical protein